VLVWWYQIKAPGCNFNGLVSLDIF